MTDLWRRHQVRDLGHLSTMNERVVDEIVDAVQIIKGADAAETVRRRGIEYLHETIDAREVTPLRDHVLERLRPSLLDVAVAVGRNVLGWDGDFYVDDYLILRINFPFEVARRADPSAENPGVGRVSPQVRELFRARKTIDPVYSPKKYHRDLPPAAWAHGPHRDSWAGHSRDGRNIWWAIGAVPAEAGMVLYPELAHDDLPPDPHTLYLSAGHPLPVPTYVPLAAGEMLIFDPEVLHGTHLNVTSGTRVAVSMRLNASRPTFDPGCFYAREFWRRAADIESGRDDVLHLRREDCLGPPLAARPAASPARLPVISGTVDVATKTIQAIVGEADAKAARLIVDAPDHRLLVVRTTGGLRAYEAACPHYGLDLADGASDGTRTYCPGCALGFELTTGRSASDALALRPHEAWEADGAIIIRTGP